MQRAGQPEARWGEEGKGESPAGSRTFYDQEHRSRWAPGRRLVSPTGRSHVGGRGPPVSQQLVGIPQDEA